MCHARDTSKPDSAWRTDDQQVSPCETTYYTTPRTQPNLLVVKVWLLHPNLLLYILQYGSAVTVLQYETWSTLYIRNLKGHIRISNVSVGAVKDADSP